MIKTLTPIKDFSIYAKPAEQAMVQALYDSIFGPIFQILGLKKPARCNSLQDLRAELRAGRIYYWDGYFHGTFNAASARMLRSFGAEFDSRKKAYKLHMANIPPEIRTDIILGKAYNKSKTDAILKHLDELEKTKLIIGSGDQALAVMDALNDQAIKTMKVLPASLMIPMDLNKKEKKDLLLSYQDGLQDYFSDWKDEAIERLKEKTSENAVAGFRADRLAAVIKNESDLNTKKAKFLARQETSRFVSGYREAKYKQAGINSYIWSTSHDERVREDHRDLNGKVFSWDSPPIVNKTTGARMHPGQDFNCRCLALPLVRIGIT
jgi:SPP1 gp7 family putative phage head morphogenesis protein